MTAMMLRFVSMLCVGMAVAPCALGETQRADLGKRL